MKKFGIYEQRRGQRAILQNTFETEDEARLELERWIVHDLTSGKGSLAAELEGGRLFGQKEGKKQERNESFF